MAGGSGHLWADNVGSGAGRQHRAGLVTTSTCAATMRDRSCLRLSVRPLRGDDLIWQRIPHRVRGTHRGGWWINRQAAARRELASGHQRAQLFGDLPVQASRFNGLQRHARKLKGSLELDKW